jgi:hypothetical protein
MRRLVCFSVLALGLAIPATGFALTGLGGSDDDGTLSVKAGLGKVTLNPFNGSAVGRVQRGSIRVTDPVASDGIGYDFFGSCDERDRDRTTSTTTCKGTNLRFRAIGGKFQIQLRGTGIYLSAVGHGQVGLDGRGEDPTIDTDGTYSLNDGPYKSLPDFGATLQLAAPAGS